MKTYTLIFLIFFHTMVQAQDSDFLSYDAIINDLSVSRTITQTPTQDPFDNIFLHGGVGLAMSVMNLRLDKNYTHVMQGVEVNFGIDLFSPSWLAEGSYRNFGQSEFKHSEQLDRLRLSEFDLMLIHRSQMGRLFQWRIGGGLAARYLTHFNQVTGQELKYTTPEWIFSTGLQAKLSEIFTFGAQISYSWAMIDETIDRSSMGTGLRIDAKF